MTAASFANDHSGSATVILGLYQRIAPVEDVFKGLPSTAALVNK
jgi:hypothetical protein